MQQIPSRLGPGGPAKPASAIRRLQVPQVAPPYDDEAPAIPARTLRDAHEDGNEGCLTAAGLPAGPGAADREPGQPASPHSASQNATRHNPGNPGAAAGAWPGQFAQALAETLAGSRPHRQLTPWTTEQVRRQIRQLGPLFGTGERPLVRRVMTAAPATGVLEVTAVVGFGPRVRVLALRLERDGAGRAWCCTAIASA
jgi:Family of unknown function (DUF6459)